MLEDVAHDQQVRRSEGLHDPACGLGREVAAHRRHTAPGRRRAGVLRRLEAEQVLEPAVAECGQERAVVAADLEHLRVDRDSGQLLQRGHDGGKVRVRLPGAERVVPGVELVRGNRVDDLHEPAARRRPRASGHGSTRPPRRCRAGGARSGATRTRSASRPPPRGTGCSASRRRLVDPDQAAAGDGAGAKVVDRVVDLVEAVAPVDEPVEAQLSRLAEPHEPRDVEVRTRSRRPPTR